MGKFVLKKGKDGQFYFNLKAGNGQIILSSEGYPVESAAVNGIESVRKNASDEGHFERFVSSNGKPYFNLKAGNGQIIGKSELYESTAAMEKGIASVRTNAPEASIDKEY
ncbi:MAG: YegP family protein [Chitinophagaceae bacterium]